MAASIPIVMIVDENAPRRAELRAMLAAERSAVVAESGYGVQAVSLVHERKPAVVMVAIEEPVARAIQTIESIRASRPAVQVIAYSSLTEVSILRQAMRAGVRDFLPEPLKRAQVLGALAALGTGGPALAEGEDAPAGETPGAGIVIAVVGAKGGIGKTTIAINLAAALAANRESSVLIVDLDIRFGDVAIMMDVDPRFTVADVAANIDNLDREGFRSTLIQHSSGVQILPSAKNPTQWRPVDIEQLKKLARFAARMFDYVILDTPGAFQDVVGAAVDVASQVLVVTTVDIASIKDTTFVLDVLEREGLPQERLLLTVNHANSANTISPAEVSRVLHKDVYWEVPYDSAVALATQLGQPVVASRPKSRAAQSFIDMAARLSGAGARPAGRTSILGRLLPQRNA